jgi:hypothetical protein
MVIKCYPFLLSFFSSLYVLVIYGKFCFILSCSLCLILAVKPLLFSVSKMVFISCSLACLVRGILYIL